MDLVVATINNSAQTSSSGVEVVRRRRDEWKKDRFGSSRRYSDEEYRPRRGDRYSQQREYDRRYSCEYSRQPSTASLADPSVASGLDWTEKVQIFIEATRTSTNLVELPRDTGITSGVMPSFDPSKPPPLLMASNPVPDYAAVAAYSDPTVPSLDGTSSLVTPDIAAMYTPYQHSQSRSLVGPSTQLVVLPTSTSSLKSLSPRESRYDAVISTDSLSSSAGREPIATVMRAPHPVSSGTVYAAEIHTAVCFDERAAEEERVSREREMKPLSAKEKKRLDMGQKEVWQYVGRKIFTDKVFLRRRKKKGSSSEEDKEELKVG